MKTFFNEKVARGVSICDQQKTPGSFDPKLDFKFHIAKSITGHATSVLPSCFNFFFATRNFHSCHGSGACGLLKLASVALLWTRNLLSTKWQDHPHMENSIISMICGADQYHSDGNALFTDGTDRRKSHGCRRAQPKQRYARCSTKSNSLNNFSQIRHLHT